MSNKHIIITYCLGLIAEMALAIAAAYEAIRFIGWLLECITNLITISMIPWLWLLIFAIVIGMSWYDSKNSIESVQAKEDEKE